jgi:hypothetical protein
MELVEDSPAIQIFIKNNVCTTLTVPANMTMRDFKKKIELTFSINPNSYYLILGRVINIDDDDGTLLKHGITDCSFIFLVFRINGD